MEIKNKGNFENAFNEVKNDKNNAVASVFKIENKNKGILQNVVFTLKNNYAKNFDSTDGSSNFLKNFNPGYNATVVEKIFKEGGLLVATTNLDEFGLGGTGEYSNRGKIFNPINKNYYVGGSSSGSAATFTTNIGFAVGSDTGDSVRLPSSYIGKIGFKPSYGAVSRYGLFSYCSSMDTVAWFTHNVNDCIVVANVLYGKDEKDLTSINVKINDVKLKKPKKIAYLDCFNLLEEYVKDKYKKLINFLQKNEKIEIVKIKPNEDLLNCIKVVYDIISFSEASSNLSNLTGVGFGIRKEEENWEKSFIKTRSENLGVMIQRRLILGSYYLEKENQEHFFIKAQKIRRLIYEWFNSIFEKYEFLIFPSSAHIAFSKNEKINEKKYKYMSYILTAANLVGNPSISIKMGSYNEMPFNISIDSNIYNDKELLSVALYIEKILGEIND